MFPVSSIQLTAAQAREFVAWLQERVEAEEYAKKKAQDAAEQESRVEQLHEAVRKHGTDTARLHQRLRGVHPESQARIAFQSWLACEGWSSPYDIDEYAIEGIRCDEDDFCESWTYAYLKALPASADV